MIDELYKLALDTLRSHLDQAGQVYSEDDGDLIVNEHRLGIAIAMEGFAEQGNQVIVPLEVQIRLDGDEGDRFRVGALGVGADRLEALRSAVQEWHLLVASPILAALGAPAAQRRKEKPPPRWGAWEVFPGRAGVRGRLPAALSPGGSFHGELWGALRKFVVSLESPRGEGFRSIFLMASDAEGTLEIQAAVDGFVSEPLTEKLKSLQWPRGEEPYLFKQLFVLKSGE